ncbi:MAG: phospholipase [Deltaproteobacteria bacterium]|nr:phospholipase [Deltaproteobacteria bacterium]
MEGEASVEREFGEAVGRLGPALLVGVDGLKKAFRRLHPPAFASLQAALCEPLAKLEAARGVFARAPLPEPSLAEFRADLLAASDWTSKALSRFVEPGGEGAMGVLEALHEHARAQACLNPLRLALPPVSAWFAESFRHADLASLEKREGSATQVGLFRSGSAEERGGFDLYVPESYDGREAWPLVVALHGGSGNGADFLWTWLREARSRKFFLLSPTSRGSTWSFNAPDVDGIPLREMVAWSSSEWNVDEEHVLLTGLSDGGTMTGIVGLGGDGPFTHLAPACGALAALESAIDSLDRAREKPIYLVHGALDWMFPVAMAREAAASLEEAGAALVYREIDDLSHTYPREENARIIEWFDPRRKTDA